jgi:integrase
LRHGIGCIDQLDTFLGDVLHSAIDDLGPGSFVAGIGVVVEAIEQARNQLGTLLYRELQDFFDDGFERHDANVAPVRTDRERNLAQRTIYNIYTVVAALFRDAKLADLIEQSPCILDERQLGPLVDKDPEWRNAAVFARDEVETIISDAQIPADRQMVYALELLAGVRPGEAAALRWRHCGWPEMMGRAPGRMT